jgi:hypothetical protein
LLPWLQSIRFVLSILYQLLPLLAFICNVLAQRDWEYGRGMNGRGMGKRREAMAKKPKSGSCNQPQMALMTQN